MYKRAVIPLDGSVLAETVIPLILEIAGPLDMEVLLVRVVRPELPTTIEGTTYMKVEDAEARRADAEEYLAPVAVELRNRGVRVRAQVRRGEPADEIVSAASEAGADLIAMSTHGRSGLGRLLFGSVAAAVLRQADIPVFLLRATEKQVTTRVAAASAR
jgi:nucleotide-binding universal stress UspA family protein